MYQWFNLSPGLLWFQRVSPPNVENHVLASYLQNILSLMSTLNKCSFVFVEEGIRKAQSQAKDFNFSLA